MERNELLPQLCALTAVSGYEHETAHALSALLAPYCDTVHVDKQGNVYGLRESARENAPTVLLDAHIDQIGFLVTEVLEGGFVRFAAVGGADPRMLLANEITILTRHGPMHGIVTCLPPHLLTAEDKDKAVGIEQMYLDTGLLDARETVAIGDPIVFAHTQYPLLGDTRAGKCMDDRAGIAAILYALDNLKEQKPQCNIVILFSTQEEVTGLGAQTGGFAVKPDFAIAIDVTHGKTPDGPSDGVFALGSGVAIGMGPNLDRALSRYLTRVAKAHDIDHTHEIMEGNTGTNAWTLQIVAHGIRTALLSIPLRYMHTPVETLRLHDIEATAALLTHVMRRFDGEVEV